MKKKFLLLPILFTLMSCSLNKPDFCFVNDPSKSYLQKNGELNGLSYEDIQSYDELGKISNANDIEFLIDSGNQVLVYLFGYTCPSCKNFMPIMQEFVYDSKIDLHLIDKDDHNDYMGQLKSYYTSGNYNSVLNGLYSPSLFLFKSPLSVEKIDISAIKSATQLENKIFEIANVTNISNFRTFTRFSNFYPKNSGLLYIYNSENNQSKTFYDSHLISYAKISNKQTCIVDWNKLSLTDKNNYKTLFNLQNDFEVVLTFNTKGQIINKYSYISETENAANLIKSYL